MGDSYITQEMSNYGLVESEQNRLINERQNDYMYSNDVENVDFDYLFSNNVNSSNANNNNEGFNYSEIKDDMINLYNNNEDKKDTSIDII